MTPRPKSRRLASCRNSKAAPPAVTRCARTEWNRLVDSIAANQVISLDPATRSLLFRVPAGIERDALPVLTAWRFRRQQVRFIENAVNKWVGSIRDRQDRRVPDLRENPASRGKAGWIRRATWVGLHGVGKLMKIDYKTTKMTVYDPRPKMPVSIRCRRPEEQDRLVQRAARGKMARFDFRTERSRSFRWRTRSRTRGSRLIQPIQTASGGPAILRSYVLYRAVEIRRYECEPQARSHPGLVALRDRLFRCLGAERFPCATAKLIRPCAAFRCRFPSPSAGFFAAKD